jgi:predicted anti-sigma-YlaC factor YlaD
LAGPARYRFEDLVHMEHVEHTEAHLSEIELDAVRDRTAPARYRRHVQECEVCRGAVEEIDALAQALAAPLLPVAVPAAQDAALRALARETGRRIANARRRRWIGVGIGLAAAAVALVLLRGIGGGEPGAREPDTRTLAQRRDINRDGRVNIVDAYLVARSLERGQAVEPGWDVTGDRVVDRRDVDAIARAAVSIAPEGAL